MEKPRRIDSVRVDAKQTLDVGDEVLAEGDVIDCLTVRRPTAVSCVPASMVTVRIRLMIPFAWQKYDLVMLDNTRFLHGRRAFTDSSREICLRMGRGVTF